MLYKSGLEERIAKQLTAANVKFTYEKLVLPYVTNHTYKPDFQYGDVIIETKGYFRRGETAKMLAVKKAHPNLDIRFIFSDEDKKISGQKQTHASWAEKNGFPYATGRIPKEWFV